MDNRVVIIHSTAQEDIGRRAMAEMEGNGSMILDRLYEWQKDKVHPTFSILYGGDKLTQIYKEKGHLVYPIEGEIICSPRLH